MVLGFCFVWFSLKNEKAIFLVHSHEWLFLNDILYFRLTLRESGQQLNFESNMLVWKIVCKKSVVLLKTFYWSADCMTALSVSQQCICSDMCPSFRPFPSSWMHFLQRAVLKPSSISFRIFHLACPPRTSWDQACFHTVLERPRMPVSHLKSFCSCVWAVINGWHKPLGTALNGWTVPCSSRLRDFFPHWLDAVLWAWPNP